MVITARLACAPMHTLKLDPRREEVRQVPPSREKCELCLRMSHRLPGDRVSNEVKNAVQRTPNP
jgi:hypothetical protein